MRRSLGIAVGLALGLSASEALALRLALPLEQLVGEASVVLVGTVERVQALRTGPSGSVYTLAELRPESWLKGVPAAGRIEVLSPGGVLPEEGLGVWISEQAHFAPGERVLVALEPSPLEDGRFMPVNRVQGKLRLGRGLKPHAGEAALDFFRRVAPSSTQARAAAPAAAIPYDFLSVAVHEQGHVTGLADLYNSADQAGYLECMGMNNQDKTMYGLIGQGDTQPRDLHQADVLGEEWLYGGLQVPIPNGANNVNLFGYFCASTQATTCSNALCTPKIRWPNLPVTYRIHRADFLSEHIPLIQQGFQVWNAVPSSSFAAQDGGDTDVDVFNSDDSVNVIRVSNPGNQDDMASLGANALAVTGFSFLLNSGNLTGADITFNHRKEFSPALPAPAATPTPTPKPASDGGGCGSVGGLPPSGPGALGGLLLLASVAASLRLFARAQGRPQEAWSRADTRSRASASRMGRG
jgi:hypothetical protein